MLLETICNSRVYHDNAYYLLGLQVGMTGRKIKRRIEDLETANEMGAADWTRAYDQFLLGSLSAPSKERFDELAERIKDPEFAVTEAFFWFWPTNESTDPALEAIANGDRAGAVDVWRGLSKKGNREATIAKHNLAVLLHYYAIDAERIYYLHHVRNVEQPYAENVVETKKAYLASVDRFWHAAFEYWEALVDDDDFWDAFADRVKAVDDPRLGSAFADEFRRQFPIAFDNINMDFVLGYATVKRFEDAKRHFKYMRETMSDSDNVDETLKSAFKPQIDKLNFQIKHCKESKDESMDLEDVRSIMKMGEKWFEVFDHLDLAESRFVLDLKNDVAQTCHQRLVRYANRTNDFESALKVERWLLSIASSDRLRDVLIKGVTQLERNLGLR